MNNLYIHDTADYIGINNRPHKPAAKRKRNNVGALYNDGHCRQGHLFLKANYAHLSNGAPQCIALPNEQVSGGIHHGEDYNGGVVAVFNDADAALQWLRQQGIALWQPA